MNALIPLHFDHFDVRTMIIDGEPWWVLNDVCAILAIANPRHAATRLRNWQKGVANSDTLGGRQDVAIVNEAGIYKLVLGSRKPIAEEFERWLTCDVIPSIRKYGQYPPPAIVDPETLPAPDSIQGDDLTSKAGRLIAELRRVSGVQDIRQLQNRFDGIISKGRFGQLKNENGTKAALLYDDTWYALMGLGVDIRYVLDGVWLHTPDERALIDDLRTLDDREKAVAMHRIGGQIETLRLADDRG